jgi:hypothetical protein
MDSIRREVNLVDITQKEHQSAFAKLDARTGNWPE